MKLRNTSNFLIFVFVILMVVVSSGCNPNKNVATTQPTTAADVNIMQYDKHSETAFTAYPRALEDAQRWKDGAQLYQIPATRQMEKNLGLPQGGPPGWFFMFKQPDHTFELYVEIVDGALYGRTQAAPIIVGEPPYEYLPIDITNLMDSDKALAAYWKDGGEEYYQKNPNTEFDFRLVHLKGTDNPIWSIFDVQDETTPLYNMDAVTGQKTNDPFQMVK